jgi:general secretion pathway protein M
MTGTPAPFAPLARTAALAIAAAALVLVYAGLVDPLICRYAADRAQREAAGERLARYERLVKDAPAIEAQLRAAKSQRVTGLFIEAPSETTASALVQERLKAMVADSGAVATSFFSLPIEQRSDHRGIPIRIVFTADTRSLQRVLYAVETATPALVIDKMFVHARTGRTAESPRPLDVELQVVGFMRAF